MAYSRTRVCKSFWGIWYNAGTAPFEVRDLLHEKLDALLQECDSVADHAALGRTVHDLDDLLFIAGRKFVKEVLQHKLQEQVERAEAADESKQCDHCKKTQTHDLHS